MKTKKHNVAPIVLAVLKRIPYGKAYVLRETEELKANSVHRFLNRRHKKGQLRDFKCITRIIYGDDRRKNALLKAIFIARERQANYTFSYIM